MFARVYQRNNGKTVTVEPSLNNPDELLNVAMSATEIMLSNNRDEIMSDLVMTIVSKDHEMIFCMPDKPINGPFRAINIGLIRHEEPIAVLDDEKFSFALWARDEKFKWMACTITDALVEGFDFSLIKNPSPEEIEEASEAFRPLTEKEALKEKMDDLMAWPY